METLKLIIPAELDGKPLRAAALSFLHMSYGQFKRAKFEGRILLDGLPARADTLLKAGQTLELFIPTDLQTLPEPADLPLIVPFEDEHFRIIDKPAPLPTAKSARQDGITLENAVFALSGCPRDFVYRPVNRLDKGTSGLMLVAKSAHAQHLLQTMLHSDDLIREYLAVVDGCLPEERGVIDLPIGKADGATVKRMVRYDADSKDAVTHYRVLFSNGQRSLVRLRLLTGRTHQIRVHLSHLGCPVTGDFLYGTERPDVLPGRFALHSAYLKLRHPITGEMIERESDLPVSLKALL